MKRPLFGPSIYYATDKNIFDALNEHKVDTATVVGLFERRNTLVSKRTPRDRLAEYFARLTHDYFDHQDIAQKLGVTPRRERLTSVDLIGVKDADTLVAAVNEVAEKWRQYGDLVTIDRKNDHIYVNIEYSTVDYGRSEFNQVQTRDGVVDFHLEQGSYVIRSTKNNQIDDFRDSVISTLSTNGEIEQRNVSLYAHTDPKVRSNFFYDLFSDLPGLELVDVTDVSVYKAGGDEDDLADTFVERVALKGKGVSRSEFLTDLGADGYYTFRVSWRAKEILGRGDHFDIEALFADPVGCTGFSFLLLGVYERVDGVVAAKRRLPSKPETIRIAQAVEGRARHLIANLTGGTPEAEAESEADDE